MHVRIHTPPDLLVHPLPNVKSREHRLGATIYDFQFSLDISPDSF